MAHLQTEAFFHFAVDVKAARKAGIRPLSLTEAAVDTHLAGQPQARFKVFDPSTAYQCRHLFVADARTYGYLVAACAPQAGFGTLQQQLDDLLDTFQLLVN